MSGLLCYQAWEENKDWFLFSAHANETEKRIEKMLVVEAATAALFSEKPESEEGH